MDKAYIAYEINDYITRYGAMILRLAMHRVNHLQEAEDITQEVFLKLFRQGIQTFHDEEHLKAWLIRVTINLCKDHTKSAWFSKRVHITEEITQKQEESYPVLEAVKSLPVKYRDVIYLHYYEGYEVKEIAELLHRKQNTVLSQLSRGRTMLKKAMIGGFEDE